MPSSASVINIFFCSRPNVPAHLEGHSALLKQPVVACGLELGGIGDLVVGTAYRRLYDISA